MKGYAAVIDTPIHDTRDQIHSPGDQILGDGSLPNVTETRIQPANVALEIDESLEALVRRIYDQIINQGNLALADEILSADFVDHVPHVFPGQPVKGPAALTWIVSSFR